MKKERGFTLIDILVAIALVAVLSGAGLSGWHEWQRQQRLWQTAVQVRQFLEMLRDDANWHTREHIISVSGDGDSWCLYSRLLQGCEVASPYTLYPAWPDVSLIEVTPSLAFYGLRNTAWGGHIRLKNRAGEWRVVVSGWGRIRMCQPSSDTAC